MPGHRKKVVREVCQILVRCFDEMRPQKLKDKRSYRFPRLLLYGGAQFREPGSILNQEPMEAVNLFRGGCCHYYGSNFRKPGFKRLRARGGCFDALEPPPGEGIDAGYEKIQLGREPRVERPFRTTGAGGDRRHVGLIVTHGQKFA